MEPRISLVTLGVTDPAHSRRFYEGLGWNAAFENEHIVFFQLNGIVLGLFRRDMLDADMKRVNSGPGAMALAYNVRAREEVASLLEQARAAGGEILKAGEDAPWGGHSGYFADPDGHAWEVAWNPEWSIDTKGGVWMPSAVTQS